MKARKRIIGGMAGTITILTLGAGATPTTSFWTPACADIQPYGVVHIGADNYFTVAERAASGQQGAFPTDIGVTVGILPFQTVQMEIGIDAFYPTDDPYVLNAKAGLPEDVLFDGAPALNVGIFNVGFKKGVTDQNVVDVVMGKTLPWSLGRLHAGAYVGNGKTLVSSDGAKEEKGWMVGYDITVIKDRMLLIADYMSGRNALGGGGIGIVWSFSKDVSVLTGPVWFNDSGLNGTMKWSVQFDINL